VTYEPQVNSDVFAMFQSEVEGRITPRVLLTKDVPPEFHDDLDYISTPRLGRERQPDSPSNRVAAPGHAVPERRRGTASSGSYGAWYSAKRDRVAAAHDDPDAEAYGDLTQGHGSVGPYALDSA
jgi:hypothetical protein